MIDVKRILAKKKPTGAEVGKALFANLIHEVQEHSVLITQDELDNLEDKLESDQDFNEYNIYRSLFKAIVDTYNRGVDLFQQFDNGISRYTSVLSECMKSDRAQQAEDEIPLILTGEQYNRYAEEAKEAGITIAQLLKQGGDTPEERFQRYRRSRRAKKGIAVIQSRSGAYKEPKSPIFTFTTLDDIKEDLHYLLLTEGSMDRLIVPALRFILSYNALVMILGRVYDIDGMEALQLNAEGAKSQLQDLGETVQLFSDTVYGTAEIKKIKRGIIAQTFIYWEAEDIEPTEDAIQQVEETLRGYEITEDTYKRYKDLDEYIDMLSKGG